MHERLNNTSVGFRAYGERTTGTNHAALVTARWEKAPRVQGRPAYRRPGAPSAISFSKTKPEERERTRDGERKNDHPDEPFTQRRRDGSPEFPATRNK